MEPELSVVIAIIAGGRDTMSSCLETLAGGRSGRNIEFIVPYDARLDGVTELSQQYPWVDFVDARSEVNVDAFGSSSREHHDILRAIGLRRARGRIIALLEDHGTPSPQWLASVLAAHEEPFEAIGGAVENGVDKLLNWAVYFCDFSRYQNPVGDGQSEFLSDSNVSYKREALQGVKNLWFQAFHETSVNWELRRKGMQLKLNPEMIVYQTRRGLRLLPALYERYVWGRSFAGTRASEITLMRRALYAVLSLVLPLILSFRVVARTIPKRRHIDRLLLALPLVFLLECVWSVGELIGYVTGHNGDPRRAALAEQAT
jgi:hypothetical protein